MKKKMGKERKIAVKLAERNQSRMYKRSPMFNRKGTINSEFATLISIFFIAPHAFFRKVFVSVRLNGRT